MLQSPVSTLLLCLLAHDWPQLLGPHRDGIYTDSDVHWPSQYAWTREVGEGFAAPVIAGGKVILFHRIKHREIVEAFDAATGNTVWKFDYPTSYKDEFGFDEGPRSAPTVANGVVYTYGAQGMLHAIDLASGRKLWHADLQEWYGAKKGFFGTACSPLVANGLLYLNVGGKDIGVAAFDAANGKLKWGATKQEASYSSPILTRFGVVFFTRRGLLLVEPSTGKVLYEHPFRSRSATSVNAATPIVDGNILFASAGYGVGAIALDLSTSPPTKLWESDDVLSVHYATPVLHEGFLYGLHGLAQVGQELRAVELKTGKVAWTMKTLGAGSVTLIKDKLLFLRDDGEMFQIIPTPAKLDVRGNFKVVEGKVRAFPAIGNGLVCMRNTKILACLK